tara:strand:+ start:2287 stop:2613 length:327 start_codon:yes stop_codon:yes gene_type:complete
MLSITLNIITIIILLVVVGLLFRLYTDKKSKTDTETVSSDLEKTPSYEGEGKEVTASDVIYDTVTDPLVVSRAYFTETGYGELGDFKGLQAQLSDTYWIHGKPIPVSE